MNLRNVFTIAFATFTFGCGNIDVVSTGEGGYALAKDIKATQTAMLPKRTVAVLLDTSGSHSMHGQLADRVGELFVELGGNNELLVVPIGANSSLSSSSIWSGGPYGVSCRVPLLAPLGEQECPQAMGSRTECFGAGGQRDKQQDLLGDGGTIEEPKDGSLLAQCREGAVDASEGNLQSQMKDLKGYLDGLESAQYTDIQGAIKAALEEAATDRPIDLVIVSDMIEDLKDGDRTADAIEGFGDREVTVIVSEIRQGSANTDELKTAWVKLFNEWGAEEVDWRTFRINRKAPQGKPSSGTSASSASKGGTAMCGFVPCK